MSDAEKKALSRTMRTIQSLRRSIEAFAEAHLECLELSSKGPDANWQAAYAKRVKAAKAIVQTLAEYSR